MSLILTRLLLFTVIFSGFVGNVSNAESFIQEGSIGNVSSQTPVTSKHGFVNLPISQWQGRRVILLPKKQPDQRSFYNFCPGSVYKVPCALIPVIGNAGRVGEVIAISPSSESGFNETTLTLKMEDNGELMTTESIFPYFEELVLAYDVENSRKKWLGKTIYMVENELSIYDKDQDLISTFKVKKFAPVTVENIVAGWDYENPVRFIVRALNGKKGFFDLNPSGIGKYLEPENIENTFWEDNPKLKYKWGTSVWKDIENELISIGMTAKQVKMSWGEPKSINETTATYGASEQWVYDGDFVYFQNGKVSAIQGY